MENKKLTNKDTLLLSENDFLPDFKWYYKPDGCSSMINSEYSKFLKNNFKYDPVLHGFAEMKYEMKNENS
jgi:hypothetical protein